MSRRIETGSRAVRAAIPTGASGTAAAPALAPTDAYEDYLGRLMKYIPAEIVGFYLVAAGVISPTPSQPNITGLWIVFGLACVLVPLYFMIVTKRDGKPILWSQVLLTTVAFPVWVFAMGGPFASFSWYKGSLAAVLLVFVTVVFGLYKPDPGA